MLFKNVLLIILNLLFFSVFSQSYKNCEKFKTIISTLADDSMQGRSAGTEGAEKAEKYLVNYYKKIGLKTIQGTYIQKFAFPKDSSHIDTAMNINGMIDNKADLTIVIGAHYDHLGTGGPKSRSLTTKKIHDGADDNASGVAMMLMLAEQLKKSGNKKFNYLFVAFSAHEDGLYGSESFVNEKIIDLNKIKLMLNFDMVGRLDVTAPIFKATKNEKDFYLDTLLNTTDHPNFEVKIADDNLSKSDASVFDKNNISTITFSTGMHDDYHKVSDTAEKINYEGMNRISEYLYSFLLKIN